MTIKNFENFSQSASNLMPTGKKAIEVLRKRAEVLAAIPEVKTNVQELTHYICFRLGVSDQYGIPYQYISEIISHANVTAVPCTPHFIAGVVNHRGSLIAILDLKQFFYNQTTVHGTDTQIIFVKAKEMTVGILADSIEGGDYYSSIQLAPSLGSQGLLKPEFIIGLHRGVVAIIHIEAMLADKALQPTKIHALSKKPMNGDSHV